MKLMSACLVTLSLLGFLNGQERIAPPALASLVATERAFARLSAAEGTREAFLTYFADTGINFTPAPTNVKETMGKLPAGRGTSVLEWTPVFGDVSSAGDMGYTTGPYVSTDLSGRQPKHYGYFFSIWKTQTDGTWKVVLDTGIRTLAPDPSAGQPRFRAAGRVTPELEGEALDPAQAKKALLQTERGIGDAAYPVVAFTSYMSDDVRLNRDGSFPLIGRQSAETYLFERLASIRFEPIEACVARSADLAYTYGSFSLRQDNRPGTAEQKGYYVRVWKQVASGQWRIAIDAAIPVREGKKP
jgi:ketosteroid isomerase-like protein